MTGPEEDFAALVQRNVDAARNSPDHRPDGSGLDDGVPLPRHVVNARKKENARSLRADGMTLRAVAASLRVSHETVRVWTAGIRKRTKP